MSTLTDAVLGKLRTRGVFGIQCEPIDEGSKNVVALPGGLDDIVKVAKGNGGVVYFAEVIFGDDALRVEIERPGTGVRETVDLSQFHELQKFEYRKGSVAFHILYVPSNGYLIRACGNAAEWYKEFRSLREAVVGRLVAQAV
ncbi:hypothetical protein DAERI_060033 [Deinococcus aerius]|uniref:Uncharacterized protein n=1 Tax=Deinococcus aerius TaxID=200253 RepID=A0A2I9CV44_9DEIO|nr:hypothetical protein [Deinococcus aerius]GBF05773.1 hypothetical protein DAERI_060033 [Deinococcus aerius]